MPSIFDSNPFYNAIMGRINRLITAGNNEAALQEVNMWLRVFEFLRSTTRASTFISSVQFGASLSHRWNAIRTPLRSLAESTEPSVRSMVDWFTASENSSVSAATVMQLLTTTGIGAIGMFMYAYFYATTSDDPENRANLAAINEQILETIRTGAIATIPSLIYMVIDHMYINLRRMQESLHNAANMATPALRTDAYLIASNITLNPIHVTGNFPDTFKVSPAYLLCPICGEKMKDPVVASDGYTYERAMLEALLKQREHLSPITREVLDPKVIIPNVLLKQIIDTIDKKKETDEDYGVIPIKLFEDAISFDTITDPVITSDGYTYDLPNITRWFADAKNKRSPLGGEELLDRKIRDNKVIREIISIAAGLDVKPRALPTLGGS